MFFTTLARRLLRPLNGSNKLQNKAASSEIEAVFSYLDTQIQAGCILYCIGNIPTRRRKKYMCTCCQNYTGAVQSNGCSCNSNRCGFNRCGYGVAAQTTVSGGTFCGNCCVRYVSFPVSGTAVVPVNAIRFYPTWGTGANSVDNGNSCGCFWSRGANNQANASSNCCGFGRCGGSAAIANYYEDYYNRQYGLNN